MLERSGPARFGAFASASLVLALASVPAACSSSSPNSAVAIGGSGTAGGAQQAAGAGGATGSSGSGGARPSGGTASGGTASGGTASGGTASGGTPTARSGGSPGAGGNGGTIAAGGVSGTAAGGASAGFSGSGGSAGADSGPVAEEHTIADVWSGHPVRFALVTRADRQFFAFFDAERRLTVGSRTLGADDFELVRLPTTLGWDSHNHVAMAIDADGFLHVSGNMHNVPLIYFRSATPLAIDSLERVGSMVGTNEQSVTYPEFFLGPNDDLIFAYRDGGSGNGNHIFNVYDTSNKSWRRLLDTPLTDGQGARNAYPVGPVQGPDGDWHLVWVWRDSPDAATNHDLSYARTRNLVDWQSAAGTALDLPIRLATSDIVDPVPSGGGMINNNTKVGFDSRKRPVVAYHKYDASGATQLYNARFEDEKWVAHQTSDWDYRWEFGGEGTLVFEIEVEPVVSQADGTLTQRWYHEKSGGWGAFRLDEATLAATATIEPPLPYPQELDQPDSPTEGMIVRWQGDAGRGPLPSLSYFLRWETLASNRDQPRDVIPPPTKLKLYGFRR
jgi:hypothetical protein